jgi:hypothetical protein
MPMPRKTYKSKLYVAAPSPPVAEYLTVGAGLYEANRVLRERSGFYRCELVTLGLIPPLINLVQGQPFEVFHKFNQISDHQIPNSFAFVATCFGGIAEDTFR